MAMHPAVRRLATTSALAVTLAVPVVSQFEGLWLTVKPDRLAYDIPTGGYGETENVKLGETHTKQYWADLLAKKLVRYDAEMMACVKVPIEPQMEASFISFSYNIGTHGFCHSGVVRHLNAGDYVGACNAMLPWNMAGGVVVDGLVIRRHKERKLCMEGL